MSKILTVVSKICRSSSQRFTIRENIPENLSYPYNGLLHVSKYIVCIPRLLLPTLLTKE